MATPEYDANSIQKLDPIDHIRKRLPMYLGDNTGEGGLSTALREIIDNSQDEFLNGHGKKITITFFADGSAEVQDQGRGIPTGINKATGENGIVLALANVGAGGKFGVEGGGYGGGSGGLNGVGTTASNAISQRFDVTVYQNGKEHKISFCQGKPGKFAVADDPFSKFSPSKDLVVKPDPRTAKEKKERPTGTTIRMWADSDLFMPVEVVNDKGETVDVPASFDVETLKFRMKSTAFLLPGLCIEFNDFRDPNNHIVDVFEFDGGIAEMLETITHEQPLMKPVRFTSEGNFTEKAAIADSNGKITTGMVDRHVDIDVAFEYVNGYDTVMKSFVNIINTKNGGTHESGFYRAMSRIIIDNIKNGRGLLKAKEEPPILEDIKDGLVSIVSIKFPEPQFTGQEKSSLGTTAITSLLSQEVGNKLKAFLDDKKNAATAKIIYTKVIEASRVRLAQRQLKEVARRKTALDTASMPSKLTDCEYVGVGSDSELLIVEGDSAGGQMKLARDSGHQALLPIRGKILNAQKASLSDALANKEISEIIQVIGAGMGKAFDPDLMRYDRVVIAADADVDGSHIRTLLIALFSRLMRPLITEGRLYTAVPPLYVVKTLGKNPETIYVQNDEELVKIQKKLAAEKKQIRMPIGRFKGLGEMQDDELWDTTLDPAKRTLRRITMNDADKAEGMIELAMGHDVAPRKTWIINSSDRFDRSVIG